MKRITVLFFLLALTFTTEAQLKIDIPKDKALVYFIRPTPYALIAKVKILCDEEYIGATRGMTYIYTFVDAGEHSFRTKELQKARLNYNFEAGKIYYIKHKILPGVLLIRRSEFEIINESEALVLLKNNALSRNQVEK